MGTPLRAHMHACAVLYRCSQMVACMRWQASRVARAVGYVVPPPQQAGTGAHANATARSVRRDKESITKCAVDKHRSGAVLRRLCAERDCRLARTGVASSSAPQDDLHSSRPPANEASSPPTAAPRETGAEKVRHEMSQRGRGEYAGRTWQVALSAVGRR